MDPELLPLLLAYADEEAPIEGRTRLQKMVFRVQQEHPGAVGAGGFPFEPYDYGPYSPELAEMISDLIEAGELSETQRTLEDGERVKYKYELKPDGRERVEETLRDGESELLQHIERIKQQYNQMALPDVLDEIYSEYPAYATESNYSRD
jgi:uncharacterized protein YwgA